MNRTHFVAPAHWHAHINRYAASVNMREWQTDRQSLTSRLVGRCEAFRVERLQQRDAQCLPDEFESLGLSRRAKVIERDVLLRCYNVAVVYAHTALPLSATASQWPLFAALGNRSLGTTLFNDPLVTRGTLQFARLRTTHPLMQRILRMNLVGQETPGLHARRSLFTRHGSSLLVTEVFLPAISGVSQRVHSKAAQ
ncbi:chorismate lyase [Rhodoferax saidenbachensis]|uniref:Probable chorismate pyruvate-lyase n=1 Tax=Rhodoferax saidenbachensis TaxID=1484693 RepID=A0ABU1ZKL3_9BURK|nr:chorismate lyase [Rhodoferax saidenbachensis]MDR7306088.1 chorismate--pyruvate lyase [Rhodoferax saidenbachensis]